MEILSIKLDKDFASELNKDRKMLRRLKEDLYLKINKGIDYITFLVHDNQNIIDIHLDGAEKSSKVSSEVNKIISTYR